MKNKYRSIFCAEVTKELERNEVRLAGWIDAIRNLGSLVFITLRDETGLIQLISEDTEAFKTVNRESTITVLGDIKLRDTSMINKDMETGEVEVLIKEFEVLGSCSNVLPFEIKSSKEANEDTRLKYRYLDLRNKSVHDNILFRTSLMDYIRSFMKENAFTEIQTPILTASSPEGARDFIVPSRKFKGKFYALPQAPQIFKQILMVSGFNKYFQIAPCFRDEDPRSDRLYGEFYQLDLEMSFATEEDVYALGEKFYYDVFSKFSNKEVTKPPFIRIPFKESMIKYGTDKPDLRNPLIIEDITNIFKNTEFIAFKNKSVRGIKVEGLEEKPNSFFSKLEEYIKKEGAKGLAYIKVNEDLTFKSAVDKFLTDEERTILKKHFSLKSKDTLFIISDEEKVNRYAGLLRTKLGEELSLIDKNKFEFCIINDFPMYEINEETNTYDFTHNPFSMPQGGIEVLNTKKPDEILAYQYDFVCNGLEMASGAVRNHSRETLVRAFEIAGYDEETLKSKFTSLYTAFKYGAPPHAGMAPGIDRILMLLLDEENIREVVCFPMSASGKDEMMGSPNTVFENQLRETHIKIRE